MNKLALKIGGYEISTAPTPEFKFTDANLGAIVSGALNIIFYLAGLLLFIWLIWGVVQYIFAGGNKEGLAKARTRITYALIGFLIVVLSFTISQYVKTLFQPQSPDITPVSQP